MRHTERRTRKHNEKAFSKTKDLNFSYCKTRMKLGRKACFVFKVEDMYFRSKGIFGFLKQGPIQGGPEPAD